jgi:hypothetical protein
MRYLIFSALALTACVFAASDPKPSRVLLGSDQSWAELDIDPHDTVQAVTRLLLARGVVLVSQRPFPGGVTLEFKGARAVHAHEIGSIFYVTVEARDRGHSSMSIDGTPAIDGRPLCRNGYQPCDYGWVNAPLSDSVDGRAEADVVRGVFSELAMRGVVVARHTSSRPPGQRAREAQPSNAACWAERHRVITAATKIPDRDDRMAALNDAPRCEGDPPRAGTAPAPAGPALGPAI